MERPRTGRPVELGRLVRVVVAAGSVGAGVIHLKAVVDHLALPWVQPAFFLALGLFQLLWGTHVLHRRDVRVLVCGAVVNAAVVGVWLASRSVGISFVPGVASPHPVGVDDGVATALAMVVVAGAVLLVKGWLASCPLDAACARAAIMSASLAIVFATMAAVTHVHVHDPHPAPGRVGTAHTEGEPVPDAPQPHSH